MKKIAIFFSHSLLETIFINKVSDELERLDLTFFGQKGQVFYKGSFVEIFDINLFSSKNFDLVINLSKNFSETKVEIPYLNCFHGYPFVDKIYDTQSTFISDFMISPLFKFLNLIKDFGVQNLDITCLKPIAELGKAEMNRFYKEIKASHLKVVQFSDEKEVLAFNISLYSSDCSAQIAKLLNLNQENIILNSVRVPVNKGSVLFVNFNLNSKIDLAKVRKSIEDSNIIYAENAISSILVENDSQLFAMELNQIGQKYSIILMFDSVQNMVANLFDALRNFLLKK